MVSLITLQKNRIHSQKNMRNCVSKILRLMWQKFRFPTSLKFRYLKG